MMILENRRKSETSAKTLKRSYLLNGENRTVHRTNPKWSRTRVPAIFIVRRFDLRNNRFAMKSACKNNQPRIAKESVRSQMADDKEKRGAAVENVNLWPHVAEISQSDHVICCSSLTFYLRLYSLTFYSRYSLFHFCNWYRLFLWYWDSLNFHHSQWLVVMQCK